MHERHSDRPPIAGRFLVLSLIVAGLLCLVSDPASAEKRKTVAARGSVTAEERAYVVEQVRKKVGVEPDGDVSRLVLSKDAAGVIQACGYVHARERDGLFVYEGQRLFWGYFEPGKPASVSGPVPDGSYEGVLAKICSSKGLLP